MEDLIIDIIVSSTPLLAISAVVFAVSVPSRLLLATYACFAYEKLIWKKRKKSSWRKQRERLR
jgi:hypothetical protein